MIIGTFGNGGKVGTGFHFDNGKIIFGVFLNKGGILEEGAEDRNTFLLGKNGTLAVDEREESTKTVFKHIGILGVFVENETGNLDIADFGIEGGGFTENIDAFDGMDVFESFTEDMIGGQAQGIIDIEN